MKNPTTNNSDTRTAAIQLLTSLPEDASWDDVMDRIYVRQAIEAGRRDVAAGRVVDVKDVRNQFGLSE